jgi:hypothetical protein
MKEETLEEAADNWSLHERKSKWGGIVKNSFKAGAKWQAERMYSEKEVLRIITSCKEYLSFGDEFNEKQWFEQFKKK